MRRRMVPVLAGALAVVAAVVAGPVPAAAARPAADAVAGGAGAAVPGTSARVAAVEVAPAGTGWVVTARTDGAVPPRADLPLLQAGDGRAAVARGSADARTFRATLLAGPRPDPAQVRLTWSTAAAGPGSGAARAAASEAPGTRAEASEQASEQATGPVLPVDPGAAGPHRVRQVDYDLGDEAVRLPSLGRRVELRARAYLPVGAPGARPLVVLLHGRHQPCYGGDPWSEVPWPCPSGSRPVPSHLGYASTARALASHGYAVVSVSANGINAWDFDAADAGQLARGELVMAHLDRLAGWQARGDGPLAGTTLDLQRVGLMGHSRGGEGVLRAYALNEARPRPYGLRALFLLAPTDFARQAAPDVALGVMLPYCDGDVSDLQGQHVLDDTRYALAGDPAPRSGILVMGANHNYFNTEWTPGTSVAESFDDWYGPPRAVCGERHPGRLSAAEQQGVGRAYMAGFFRAHLGREARLLPLLDGSGARAASAGRAVVHVEHQAPAGSRTDVARLDGRLPEGAVARRVQARPCAGAARDGVPRGPRSLPLCSPVGAYASGHFTSSPLAPTTPGAALLRLAWSSPGSLRLPVRSGDVRRLEALSLRMAVADPAAGAADLTVRVVDAAGRHADVAVSAVSSALRPLPGRSFPLPHVQLRTVRVPLRALAGVDLRRVAAVELRTDRTAQGAVLVGDIAFQATALGRPGEQELPVVELAGPLQIEEGDAGTRTVDLPVTLSRASARPVSFQAGVTPLSFDDPGTVAARTPVAPLARRVGLAPGERRASVPVRVTGNRTYGPDVPVLVAVSAPRGALLGPSLVTGQVLDDDPPPTVRIAPARAAEGGTLRFAVTVSPRSGLATQVRLRLVDGTARRGTDFAGALRPQDAEVVVEVPPGATSAVAAVDALRDDREEGPETFRVRVVEVLQARLVGPRTVTGTISGP